MKQLANQITEWIKNYANNAGIQSLVVGISGGIDSAVVSALCARTGLNTVAVTMPIRQRPDLHDLSMRQGAWLAQNFDNVQPLMSLNSVLTPILICWAWPTVAVDYAWLLCIKLLKAFKAL